MKTVCAGGAKRLQVFLNPVTFEGSVRGTRLPKNRRSGLPKGNSSPLTSTTP